MKRFYLQLTIVLSALSATTLASGASTAYAKGLPDQPTDSIKNTLRKDSVPADTTVHELLGIEVKSSRVIHRPGSSEYFPTRKEKNASADAMALLQRMYIPQLRVLPSGITSASGMPVTYFINGTPANKEDLEGMYMKDVKSVICLENPSDAKYLGKPFVVDFIMQQYEYGGYTKLYATGFLLSVNQFTERINSKFTFKRMTYDLCVAPMQSSYRFEDERALETFHLAGGDVTRTVDPTSYKLTGNKYPVQFRAMYRKGYTTVSNRIGYSFNNIGKDSSSGMETLHGQDRDRSTSYSTEQPNRTNALDFQGYVSAQPNPVWAISADYGLSYSHYNKDYSYVTSLPFEINRQTREDATSANATLRVTRNLGVRHKVYVSAGGNVYHSNAHYYGDTRFRTSYTRGQGNGRVGYSFTGKGLYINAHGGIATEHSDVNGIVTDYTSPYGYASVNFNPNRTHNLNAYAQYSIFSPISSSSNPAITRVNELMYSTGNPEIRPYPSVTVGVHYTLEAIHDRLWLNFDTDLTHLRDRFRMVYSLTDDGQAVIRGYDNTGDCTTFSIGPWGTLTFFDKKLWINVVPNFITYDPGKGGDISRFSSFDYYIAGTLLLGNFNVMAYYQSPKKYANPLMDSTFKTRGYYYLEGGWGNGDINVTLSLVNIFNRSWDGDIVTTGSPVFDGRYTQLSQRYRQKVKLSLTYTFGYGKKIQQNDSLDGNVTGAGSNVGK